MENGRFVVLTGHLTDYPLSDLVGILRHQRKTGRLLVEYPKGPAALFFQEGELVDAQLNNLTGLQAICVAMSQPPSAFNFNPLIAPSGRSIENSLQRVVSELLGCWDESAVQIEAVATDRTLRPEPLAIPASTSSDITAVASLAPVAPPLLPQRSPTNRTVLMIAAAALVMAGLSTVIAFTGGFRTGGFTNRVKDEPFESKASPALQDAVEPLANLPQSQSRKSSKIQTGVTKEKAAAANVEPTAAREGGTTATSREESTPSDQSNQASEARNKLLADVGENKDKATSEAQAIDVVMQVENGRVLKASIASHKAGMDNYEALALRIARQRRYPSKGTGQETVRITVKQPN